jgi:hypothetical protein
MIKIAVTPAAFVAVEATLPLGTSSPRSMKGRAREIWIDEEALNKLDAMRAPGESYSDVILRLAVRERR